MSNHTPYLQRRGDNFSFRIAVPSDLLPIIGKREFIKSLHTTDKHIAVPLALRLAATAKQLFNNLKTCMSESNDNKLRELLIEAKGKGRLALEREEHENELFEQRQAHLRELKLAKLQVENEVFKLSLAIPQPLGSPTYPYLNHRKLNRGP